MKKQIKRYSIFIIFLVINLSLFIVKPDIAVLAFQNSWANAKEMLAVIPPIFILLGLLDVWVERKTLMQFMGEGSGMKGTIIAFLLGSAAAGPLYAAFPIASIMLKKGSSLFNVFIFIGAWSTTKIPMLTFEASSLGLPFTLLRLGMSVIGITLIAGLLHKVLPKKDKEEIYRINEMRTDM